MAGYQRKGKKYSKITYEKRIELLDLILNHGQKITETAQKLHLKLPTAKAILSNYRKKNHIFQRKNQVFSYNQVVSQHQNQSKQEANEDFQRISAMQRQQCQLFQNVIQSQGNKVYQNDVSYLYPLWYGNMNPWGYFYTPFTPYQF